MTAMDWWIIILHSLATVGAAVVGIGVVWWICSIWGGDK